MRPVSSGGRGICLSGSCVLRPRNAQRELLLFSKSLRDLDLDFEDATEDEEYLSSLSQVLEKMSGENFDLVFFQAGVDGLKSDQLGLLHLSREGLRRRNEQVFAWRKKFDLPLLIFMGGGYANPIDETVDAFCDLFLAAAGESV